MISRRSFIRSIVGLAAALPFLRSTDFAFAATKEAPLPAGAKACPESDPVATAIGYKMDGTKADVAKYPQAKGKAGKSQKCSGCALYTSQNEGWGKCQMLTAGLVNANGWCGSWQKKA